MVDSGSVLRTHPGWIYTQLLFNMNQSSFLHVVKEEGGEKNKEP